MLTKIIFFDIGDTLVTDKKWLPGSKEALIAAKSKGVRIGLISNTGDLSREKLQALLPADFNFNDFEEGLVMLSSEIGISKPDLGIFTLAVHHANVAPQETMFVGENLTECLTAQTAGMIATRIAAPKKDFEEIVAWFSR